MSARFSEAEAAEIDAARGTTERGTWLREAALSVARGSRRKPPGKRGSSIASPVTPERLQELRDKALAADIEPVSDPAELARLGIEAHCAEIAAQSAPKPANCKHRNLRMAKGVCPDCKTYVAKR